MDLEAVNGAPLAELVVAAAADGGRDRLYDALLAEPLIVAFLSHQAEPGPATRLSGGALTRLVEAPALKVPAVPLYLDAAALRAGAAERGYWPDGIERAAVFEQGAVFPLLRGQPGALLAGGGDLALPLDAGELAALADRMTPVSYHQALRALVARHRGREAAARLAVRPLYVLGHPRGGLLVFEREIPAFLHLASAERFALRLRAQTGDGGQHGMVSGADLFRNAYRGKLQILVEPGPDSFRLRSIDLR